MEGKYLKVHNIHLENEEVAKWDANSYPHKGIFIVNEANVVAVTFGVSFISSVNGLIDFFVEHTEPETTNSFSTSESSISESLFLKSLAIISGKVDNVNLDK